MAVARSPFAKFQVLDYWRWRVIARVRWIDRVSNEAFHLRCYEMVSVRSLALKLQDQLSVRVTRSKDDFTTQARVTSPCVGVVTLEENLNGLGLQNVYNVRRWNPNRPDLW